jgi:NhaA family Na+:H+ antiporter
MVGPVAVGTALALFLGKQIGIFLFTIAGVRLGWARLPTGASASKLFGASIVAGIGFTVALFIAGLAYPGEPALLDQAKLGILAGSLISGIVGALVLWSTRPMAPTPRNGGTATERAAGP